MKPKTEIVKYDYVFSDEELKNMGLELARLQGEKESQEEKLKAEKSRFKGKIDALELEASVLARELLAGRRPMAIEASYRLDRATRERIWIHPDTGEEIKRTPFRQEDDQRIFDFASTETE